MIFVAHLYISQVRGGFGRVDSLPHSQSEQLRIILPQIQLRHLPRQRDRHRLGARWLGCQLLAPAKSGHCLSDLVEEGAAAVTICYLAISAPAPICPCLLYEIMHKYTQESASVGDVEEHAGVLQIYA